MHPRALDQDELFLPPRLMTSFGRICTFSVYETTSAGDSCQLYKPLQVHLTSHLAPSLLASPSLLTGRGAVTRRAMSAAKCLATLTVVLVAAVCAAHGQERIKMCGRELIRLAVSSCGNSRLRRSIPDLEPGQNQYSTHCK